MRRTVCRWGSLAAFQIDGAGLRKIESAQSLIPILGLRVPASVRPADARLSRGPWCRAVPHLSVCDVAESQVLPRPMQGSERVAFLSQNLHFHSVPGTRIQVDVPACASDVRSHCLKFMFHLTRDGHSTYEGINREYQ